MTEQNDNRRKTQQPFYDAIMDRRKRVRTVPAIPGTIRPAPDQEPRIERRRFPESGSE